LTHNPTATFSRNLESRVYADVRLTQILNDRQKKGERTKSFSFQTYKSYGGYIKMNSIYMSQY